MSLTTTDGPAIMDPQDCLAVLNEAIGPSRPASGGPGARKRIIASSDPRSPDEGIALLTAYVSIADRRVRQAVLDTLLAVAPVDQSADT